MREDQIEEQLARLRARKDVLDNIIEQITDKIAELEAEYAECAEMWPDDCADEIKADDDAQRCADMNATLRDIGGGL